MPEEIQNHTIALLQKLREDMADGFRSTHAELGKLTASHQNLTAEARLANAHVAALLQGDVHTAHRIAELDVRLSRVEKRLELREE